MLGKDLQGVLCTGVRTQRVVDCVEGTVAFRFHLGLFAVLRERDADLHVVLVAHKLKIRHGNTVRQIEVVFFKDI